MFKQYSIIRSLIYSSFILAFSLYRATMYAQVPAMPPQQKPNPMLSAPQAGASQEELLKWQQEVDTEINKYVSTLTPEQQQQFYKDVDELTNAMNNMTDEELNSFLSTVMSSEEQMSPASQQPSAPVPSTTPKPAPKPQEEAKHIVIPVKYTIEHMRKTLFSIADHIDNFLLKIKTLALPGERILKNWLALNMKSKTSWDVMRADLEVLSKRLHTIAQEHMPGTQKYRYMPLLVENESLCNNLERINDILQKAEAAIEPPAFGLGELTNTAQEAIEKTARILTEALYLLNISAALESIIKQFEPEAKKLRESEETAKKQASEAAKRKEKPARLVQTPETAPFYSGPGAGPLYPGYAPYQPTPYTPPAKRAEEEEKKKAEKEDKEKKGDAKKGEKKKEEGAANKEKAQEDKRADELFEKLHSDFDEFKDLLEEFPQLKAIGQHMLAPGKSDPLLEKQALPKLATALTHIHETLKSLRIHLKRMSKRGNIKIFTQELSEFNNKYLSDMRSILAQIDAITQNPHSVVSAEKRKAYLGTSEPEAQPKTPPAPKEGEQAPAPKPAAKEEVAVAEGKPLQTVQQSLKSIIDYFNKPIA